jgi:hypothetical protein
LKFDKFGSFFQYYYFSFTGRNHIFQVEIWQNFANKKKESFGVYVNAFNAFINRKETWVW